MVLLVYSVILSKGIAEFSKDVEMRDYPLIGSTDLINTMLVGQAVPNLHDGVIYKNGKRDPGIHKRSDIGYL